MFYDCDDDLTFYLEFDGGQWDDVDFLEIVQGSNIMNGSFPAELREEGGEHIINILAVDSGSEPANNSFKVKILNNYPIPPDIADQFHSIAAPGSWFIDSFEDIDD